MRGRSDIKPTQAKDCAECGSSFQRRRLTSGRLEDFAVYGRRLYCSLSCANSQTKGGDSRSASHVQARKHLRSSCECCGSTQKLHAHHCDENWANNDPTNLQTLCESCHRSWHSTQRHTGVMPAGRRPAQQHFHSSKEPQAAPSGCADTATQSMPKLPESGSSA